LQEEKQKKIEYQEKRNLVKQVLDKQLADQLQDKQRTLQYNKQMDRLMLHNAKKEQDKER